MRTSVIIPTRGRAEQARACVEGLLETIQGHDAEVVLVVDNDSMAPTRHEYRFGRPVRLLWGADQNGAVACWNVGARAADGDAFVLGADDLVFTPGWLDAALATLAKLPDGSGVVGLNGLDRNGGLDDFASHFLVTRDYCERFNGGVFVCPHYRSYYVDIEIHRRARALGRYAWAKDAIVEHRHHAVGKADVDSTYTLAAPNMALDGEIYAERQAAGFPDDYAPILAPRLAERAMA